MFFALQVLSIFLALLLSHPASAQAPALPSSQALSLLLGDNETRVLALRELLKASAAAPPEARKALDDFLELMEAGEWRVHEKKLFKASGVEPVPEAAEEPVVNNALRQEINGARAALALLSPELSQRSQAAKNMGDALDDSQLPLLEMAYASERDIRLKEQLDLLRARISIASNDRNQRAQAVQKLSSQSNPQIKSLLLERLQADGEADPALRGQIQAQLTRMDSRLAWGERLGSLFTGLSLGSILLLSALGLAITYGLMGVINMAHGELIMVGAYATWQVQNLFKTWWPNAFDAYLLAAIPVSFAVAALLGAIMERTVIRRLYGRPLETLLATWGISLVLMQLVRSIFGAQNVQVENPAWLSGGLAVLPNLTLPYNRLGILVFTVVVLLGLTLLVQKTRFGLFIRGVTQNRSMAACVGVNTAKTDTAAFALGSGLAGLAGCALSQVGNVGPDLGQAYIVDAFLVVVLGGVGQLIGTVYAAMGLGLVNKILEGWQGAVLAKIMILVAIVLIIQKRPQGLFALKGRSIE
jgi:urea transport system permease protein